MYMSVIYNFYMKVPVIVIDSHICLWHRSPSIFLRAAKKMSVHSGEIFLTGQHSAAQTMATCECASSTKHTYTWSRYQLIRCIFRNLLPPRLLYS